LKHPSLWFSLLQRGAWRVLAPGPGYGPRYLNGVSNLESDGGESCGGEVDSGSGAARCLVDQAALGDRCRSGVVSEGLYDWVEFPEMSVTAPAAAANPLVVSSAPF